MGAEVSDSEELVVFMKLKFGVERDACRLLTVYSRDDSAMA